MATNQAERTERRISAFTSLFLCAVTVIAQVLVTVLLSHFLHAKAYFFYFLFGLAGAIVAIRVYQRPGSPSYKLVWMCLLLALPVTGIMLFCFWGGTHQAKSLSMNNVAAIRESESRQMASANNVALLKKQAPAMGRLASYLEKQGFPLYRNTNAHYLSSGEDFFEDLIEHLSQAETYIFMEYYILAEGQIWNRLFDVLKERTAVGVEVRIIFDDFGNITRLSDETLQRIQDAGIEVEVFNPVHRYVSRIYFNYRDHRKMTVIDGQFAYTGGINIGDEYANIVPRFGHWKDTGVRIEGEGVWTFAAQFIRMWKRIGHTLPNEDDYYRPRMDAPESSGFCQPFMDGPENNPDNPIEDTYLQLIASAKRFLYITTPYFAVEEYMQRSLCIAADAGVDVRICIPAIPDHKFTYMVAETYWGELLAHGVKIYKYTPGFIHAKSVMVDREAALIGSTNMDYRTFQLHYECAALFYRMPVVEELLSDMDEVMDISTPYRLEDWNRRPWYRRIFASILKLGAVWL